MLQIQIKKLLYTVVLQNKTAVTHAVCYSWGFMALYPNIPLYWSRAWSWSLSDW